MRRSRTEFSLNGDAPRKLIQILVSEYGPDNVKIEEDGMMKAEDMEWYREEAHKQNDGKETLQDPQCSCLKIHLKI